MRRLIARALARSNALIAAGLAEPGFCREVFELHLGPGAEMRDDLGSTERTELRAMGEILAVGEAVEEAAGEEVAGTGGVDHFRNRRSRHGDAILGGNDNGALLAAG